MDTRHCRHGVKENDPCMDCIREEEGGPQPDRSARIRERAEKMLERFDGEFAGDVVWTTEQAWKIAGMRVDDLDRLEAAEREKERESER